MAPLGGCHGAIGRTPKSRAVVKRVTCSPMQVLTQRDPWLLSLITSDKVNKAVFQENSYSEIWKRDSNVRWKLEVLQQKLFCVRHRPYTALYWGTKWVYLPYVSAFHMQWTAQQLAGTYRYIWWPFQYMPCGLLPYTCNEEIVTYADNFNVWTVGNNLI